MSVFRKPHIREFSGARALSRRYPYPRRWFVKHDIYPLLVLDGGAFFFTQEHIGGATATDFMTALERGTLLAPWRVNGELHWDLVFDQTVGTPCRPAFEKHVWLNRLYFLLPIAQRYLRTQDEKWAKLWFHYFSDWMAAHPYDPEQEALPKEMPAPGSSPSLSSLPPCKQCWFDMQVTWRLLVLLHSVFLLADSKSMTKKRWHRVYDAILLHARHVFREADRVETGYIGNHFLQMGNALLCTGILLPEFPDSREFIAAGRRVIGMHMRRDFLADGGSIEASPSYAHFIARQHLEAYLLLKENSQPAIRGLRQCVRRQYNWLAQTASPAGLTLQVSESYAFDAAADIARVSELFALPKPKRKRSVCLQDSCFAVLRNRRMAAYVDGMRLIPSFSHHHPGKPNVLLYVDQQPVLVDSGACNYDKHMRMDWFKLPQAHNVVTVTGLEKTAATDAGAQPVPTITVTDFADSAKGSWVTMEHRLDADRFSYTWTRTVRLHEEELEIVDVVKASCPVAAKQIFHFAPLNLKLTENGRAATIQMPDHCIEFEQGKGHRGDAFRLDYKPATDCANHPTEAPQITTAAQGKSIKFRVKFVLLP